MSRPAKDKRQAAPPAPTDIPFHAPDWPAAQKPEMVAVNKITPHPENPRIHPDGQIKALGASFDEFGVVIPPVVDEKYRLMAGEGRWITAKSKGIEYLPCIVVRGWTEIKKRRFMFADNKLHELGQYDQVRLQAVAHQLQVEGGDLLALGVDELSLEQMAALEAPGAGDGAPPAPSVSLADRFGVVPFSVMNAREGWWQNRKRAWLALGIQSEVGRGENLLKFSESVQLGGTIQNGGAAKRKKGNG